jgi:hypothetical protein
MAGQHHHNITVVQGILKQWLGRHQKQWNWNCNFSWRAIDLREYPSPHLSSQSRCCKVSGGQSLLSTGCFV